MKFSKEVRSKDFQTRHQQKLDIVLRWIAEHDFSCLEVLAILLDQKPKSTHRFFDKLFKREYLVRFRAKATIIHRADLVRIGSEGVRYLLKHHGIDKRRQLRSDEYARRVKIGHDLLLQKYLAAQHKNFGNVFAERNITGDEVRPDAILAGNETGYFEETQWPLDMTVEKPAEVEAKEKEVGYDSAKYLWVNPYAPVAVEVETSKKSAVTLYLKINRYIRAMQEGRLRGVIYVFDDEAMLASYKKIFDKTTWLDSFFSKDDGKLKRGNEIIMPADHPARQLIHFVHEPALESQKMPKLAPQKGVSCQKLSASPTITQA